MSGEQFMAWLRDTLPEVAVQIDEYSVGLLHPEMATFRRATEQAIDSGRLWEAEQHFRLVAEMLAKAEPDLENALLVSYLEDFALGEWTPARWRAVKERMPEQLRAILNDHNWAWGDAGR